MGNRSTMKYFLIIMLLIFLYIMGVASDDIALKLRFYKGYYENGDNSNVVISSYFQGKGTEDNVFPFVETEKEIQKLREIYKLKNVKQLGTYDVTLKNGKAVNVRTNIVVKGNSLFFTLTPNANDMDRFIVKMIEDKVSKPLLESEIIVPKEKTVVIGFKDSTEKIYFLAVSQRKVIEYPGLKNVKKIEVPKFVNFVGPKYPVEALKQRIEGSVVLVGRTDTEGKMLDIKVLSGHPLFTENTVEAFKTWKFSPWKLDGVKKPVICAFVFIFKLKEASKLTKNEIEDIHNNARKAIDEEKLDQTLPRVMAYVSISESEDKNSTPEKKTFEEMRKTKKIEEPKLVRRTEPVFPVEALNANIEGDVVLFLKTDITGKGIEIKKLAGPSVLADSASKSIMNWKYTPWKVDGVAKPIEANVIIIFRAKKIPEDKMDELVNEVMKSHKTILDKAKNPTGLPRLMEVVIVEGEK